MVRAFLDLSCIHLYPTKNQKTHTHKTYIFCQRRRPLVLVRCLSPCSARALWAGRAADGLRRIVSRPAGRVRPPGAVTRSTFHSRMILWTSSTVVPPLRSSRPYKTPQFRQSNRVVLVRRGGRLRPKPEAACLLRPHPPRPMTQPQASSPTPPTSCAASYAQAIITGVDILVVAQAEGSVMIA